MGIRIINAPSIPEARISTPGDVYITRRRIGPYAGTLFLHVRIGDEHSLIDLQDGGVWDDPVEDIDVLLRGIAEDFTYVGTIAGVELHREGV